MLQVLNFYYISYNVFHHILTQGVFGWWYLYLGFVVGNLKEREKLNLVGIPNSYANKWL